MIYQHLAPPPSLAGFVQKYLLIHYVQESVWGDSLKPRLFKPYPARPEHCMSFTAEGFDLSENPETGQTIRITPNTIFGQPVSRVNLYPSSTIKLFRVFFQPGAMFRLFGIPLSEFTNSHIDTESFIGQEVRAVNELLANASTYQGMVDIVNDYLWHKVSRLPTTPNGLDKVAILLLTSPTRFSLDWLANQACLSPRQFNRKFTERMGVGPKLYARITRYYQAFQFREENPSMDWLSIAIRFGYTDVQHLAKDFREFAGVTPNRLMKEQAQTIESVLKLR